MKMPNDQCPMIGHFREFFTGVAMTILFVVTLTGTVARSSWSIRQALREEQALAAGNPAPEFDLPAVHKRKRFALKDARGKTTVLFFYAKISDRRQDSRNVEAMQRLHEELRKRDAQLIVVAFGKDYKDVLEQFGGAMVTDADGNNFRRYRAFRLPKIVVVDLRGVMRYATSGLTDQTVSDVLREVAR